MVLRMVPARNVRVVIGAMTAVVDVPAVVGLVAVVDVPVVVLGAVDATVVRVAPASLSA